MNTNRSRGILFVVVPVVLLLVLAFSFTHSIAQEPPLEITPTSTPEPGDSSVQTGSTDSSSVLEATATGRGFTSEDFTAHFYNDPDLVSYLFSRPYAEPIDFDRACWGEDWPYTGCKLIDELPDGRDYSIQWLSKLLVPADGDYTFTLADVDDGARLFLDGIEVVDKGWYWPSPDQRPSPQTVSLTAGLHDIRIDYEQRVFYRASLQVRWAGPGLADEVIPLTTGPGPFCTISGVPLIKQTASPWGADQYDNSSKTIGQWGCALTSGVMIINHHGTFTGFTTNPRLLNNWLKGQPDGYIGAYVNWNPIARYARNNGVSLHYHGRTGRDDTTLHTYLCDGNPVVLQVPGHFVVATGEARLDDTETWRINDPGFTRTDLRAYGNTYNGIRKYSRTSASSALLIGASPTVQFLVIDPSGHRTGFDPVTGETLYGIEGATYTAEYYIDVENPEGEASSTQYFFELFHPVDGTYTVQLWTPVATEYKAYFFGYDEADTPSTATDTGQLSGGSTQTYLAHYSSAIGQEIEVELVVDIDIKPGSCPNPFIIKGRGTLPIAVLGTEDFDVTTIDPATIQLTREGYEAGVSPLRWSYEDVATPFVGELCECHDLNGDGYADLTLKFKAQEVKDALELDDEVGNTIPLIVTGNLMEDAGGTPIEGSDCVWVLRTDKR